MAASLDHQQEASSMIDRRKDKPLGIQTVLIHQWDVLHNLIIVEKLTLKVMHIRQSSIQSYRHQL